MKVPREEHWTALRTDQGAGQNGCAVEVVFSQGSDFGALILDRPCQRFVPSCLFLHIVTEGPTAQNQRCWRQRRCTSNMLCVMAEELVNLIPCCRFGTDPLHTCCSSDTTRILFNSSHVPYLPPERMTSAASRCRLTLRHSASAVPRYR